MRASNAHQRTAHADFLDNTRTLDLCGETPAKTGDPSLCAPSFFRVHFEPTAKMSTKIAPTRGLLRSEVIVSLPSYRKLAEASA